ncbi:mycothione reductase [Brachybacterium phenoliresistens]|uniref:Mycothione reductase n=1 Tax=Brachybacterium phenoliresistens TaxID=396014 RepID=Z9JSD6_9MICO|nr:mycothione reductase [Brachybacterium phenoliresistens]EWS81094.1 mycothione reductase [Brachybacterium phenoliresistens]
MTHYDIALIGSGSANSLPGPDLSETTIVQIDRGVGPEHRFGGTCLNLGCIPTKMFVHTANLASAPARSSRFGVDETLDAVRWRDVRDRIFGRIDPISAGGEDYRAHHEDNANLTLLRGTARFTRPASEGLHHLRVELADGGTEEISAGTVVIGAGSRPAMPPIAGLAEARPLTSDTIMRIDELPASIAILGSGVIAAELAHVLASFGVEVTIIARGDRLLRRADDDVSARLTEVLSARMHVVTGFHATRVERDDDGVRLHGERGGAAATIRAEELLVATGRTPNADLVDAAAAGIDVSGDGRIEVDAYQRVLAGGEVLPGAWALGDVSSPHQLKHVANHELRIVRHNLRHPEALRRSDEMPVAYGVFSSPQVAAVGMTEKEARASGRTVRVAVQEYASIAYGWAMEDTTGFAKIIVDADSELFLGAHIIGPEATSLIQLITQAMSTGQRPRDIAATQYWIHPAMPELIENALLQLV